MKNQLVDCNTPNLCPLCETISEDILQIHSSERAASHVCANRTAQEQLQLEEHIKKLWGTDTCKFLNCKNCGLSFASPFVAGDSVFYTTVYNKTADYPNWKWEFAITLKKIKNIALDNQNNRFSLLEIGAGSGKFVKMLLENGLADMDMLTTEYSDAGIWEIEKLGVRCVDKNLWELCEDKSGRKFDFICMFQVLEHMDDLDQVFASLSELSNENAHLFIAVPNNFNRVFFEKMGCIEDVPPTHISRWSYESFKYAGQKFGWNIIEHQIEPNRLHINIAKLLAFKYRDNPIIGLVNNIRNLHVRRAMKLVTYTPLIIFNIHSLLRMNIENLGVVQWVMFKKH